MRGYLHTAPVVLGLLWAVGPAWGQLDSQVRLLPPVHPADMSARLVAFTDPAPQPVPPQFHPGGMSNPTQQTGIMTSQAPAIPGQNFYDPTHLWDNYGCDTCDSCGPSWFGSIGGLVMTRNRPNFVWTTLETGLGRVMGTQDCMADWGGGGEVTLGYQFAPCGPSLAFTYWSVTGMEGAASRTSATNDLFFAFELFDEAGDPVLIDGNPSTDYFDNASRHSLERGDRVNNFELNFLQSNFMSAGRLQVSGLFGFRYFRFSEYILFQSVAGVANPTEEDEINLKMGTTNNLFGGQFGTAFNYSVTDRLGLYLAAKAGVYGNQMITRTELYLSDGTEGFDSRGYKADFSFLAELDFGLNYAFTPTCRGYAGYRVVGVSNVALADNILHGDWFSDVWQNGDLILHGATFGVTWDF